MLAGHKNGLPSGAESLISVVGTGEQCEAPGRQAALSAAIHTAPNLTQAPSSSSRAQPPGDRTVCVFTPPKYVVVRNMNEH